MIYCQCSKCKKHIELCICENTKNVSLFIIKSVCFRIYYKLIGKVDPDISLKYFLLDVPYNINGRLFCLKKVKK